MMTPESRIMNHDLRFQKTAEEYVDPLSSDFDDMPYSPHILDLLEKTFVAGAEHAYALGRAEGIEEAARRCEREAKALEPFQFPLGRAADVALSCANWIRALASEPHAPENPPPGETI